MIAWRYSPWNFSGLKLKTNRLSKFNYFHLNHFLTEKIKTFLMVEILSKMKIDDLQDELKYAAGTVLCFLAPLMPSLPGPHLGIFWSETKKRKFFKFKYFQLRSWLLFSNYQTYQNGTFKLTSSNLQRSYSEIFKLYYDT